MTFSFWTKDLLGGVLVQLFFELDFGGSVVGMLSSLRPGLKFPFKARRTDVSLCRKAKLYFEV